MSRNSCSTYVTVDGVQIKENDDMVLVGITDDRAVWYHKALIEGVHLNPFTRHISFRASKRAAVRSVRLR